MKEFRLYTFGNFYMSSIQQGIQALHSTTEIFIKYENSSSDFSQRSDLFDWANTDKTVICLNGGMDVDLQIIKTFFEQPDNPYAWSYFNEAPEAMNGMLTNVSIILPDIIYKTAQDIRSRKCYFRANELMVKIDNSCDQPLDTFSNFEIGLIDILIKCSLAR